jgi:hypothetical protein
VEEKEQGEKNVEDCEQSTPCSLIGFLAGILACLPSEENGEKAVEVSH